MFPLDQIDPFPFSSVYLFYRTVRSPRTSLTLPSMFTGLAILDYATVTTAANAGISLSTVLNVQAPFQLTVFCTCGKEVVH